MLTDLQTDGRRPNKKDRFNRADKVEGKAVEWDLCAWALMPSGLIIDGRIEVGQNVLFRLQH